MRAEPPQLREGEKGVQVCVLKDSPPLVELAKASAVPAFVSEDGHKQLERLLANLSAPEPPHSACETGCVGQVVLDTLRQLPPGQVQLLLLHEVAGLSSAEIASQLVTSSRAVAMRLCRGRTRFMQVYRALADSRGLDPPIRRTTA